MRTWTPEEDATLTRLRREGQSFGDIAGRLPGRDANACRCRHSRIRYQGPGASRESTPGPAPARTGVTVDDQGDARAVTVVSHTVRTLAAALREAAVDAAAWEVERHVINKWDVGAKLTSGAGDARTDAMAVTELWQVKVWLRAKTPARRSLEDLLAEIAGGKLRLPAYAPPRAARGGADLALEVSVMDPHLGMRCFTPQSDHAWDMDGCERAFMATVERLLALAGRAGPFSEVVVPVGNDYLHADNVWHTTTAGTPQPEADSMHEAWLRGEKLMLWYTERLRQVAPVLRVFEVPGNHSRLVDFCMGRLVRAFYQGAGLLDKSVFVDASPSPYKFWNFGVNLIGFEHGHSIPAVRLAALMANETRRTHWQQARYCEWHLGDQHRKGSSVPAAFEEQGVSIEYLPGLTPPNEWHRLKGFNWQKRGAFAFVYDRARGPQQRLQVNFDGYTGEHLGGGPVTPPGGRTAA